MKSRDEPGINTFDVGARIRQLRKLFGYSQRELAKKAGLTHGAISQAERNNASPSVGSLRKILDVFSVTFSEFFSEEEMFLDKPFYGKDELIEVGGNGVSLKQVGVNLKGKPLQLLYEHYEVGASTAVEPYGHTGDEGGVVVSGRIELTVGGETRVLGPGEAYLFESRIPHRFTNPGPEECVIVSAMTPPI
jgi:transcriptional regulator with XRE-family HTH domain